MNIKGAAAKRREGIKTIPNRMAERWSRFWQMLGSPDPVYRWAGAAVALLLVAVVLYQPFSKQDSQFLTREIQGDLQIQLITPLNAGTVESHPQFSWSGLTGVKFYNLLLLDLEQSSGKKAS